MFFMADVSTRSRQSAGQPTGGEFATEAKGTDTGVSLSGEQPSAGSITTGRSEVFSTRYETLQEKVDAISAEVDQAFLDLGNDADFRRFLDFNQKFHRYSWNNMMLIMLQTGGEASRVAGKRRWEELGRTVKESERGKGIVILAPCKRRMPVLDRNGDPKLDDDGKKVYREAMVGTTTTTIYDISQTEGEPVPEFDTPRLSETPPEGYVDDLHAAATAAGFTVRYEALDSFEKGGAHGWASGEKNEIVVDSTMTPAEQAKTLSHELGHVYAGHTDPEHMAEYQMSGAGGCRGESEVVADSVAYQLMRLNGMSDEGLSGRAHYAWGWAGGDVEVLRRATDSIDKTTKKVLAAHEFGNLVDADPVAKPATYTPKPRKKTTRKKTAKKATPARRNKATA